MLLRDPTTATVPGLSPGWFTGGDPSCNEIRTALNRLYSGDLGGGVPAPEGGKTPGNDISRSLDNLSRDAIAACETADTFNRTTLRTLSDTYASSPTCRARDALNTANQIQCRLNDACRLASIVAARARDDESAREAFLRRAGELHREWAACSEAALNLRWISQGCSGKSSLVKDEVSTFPEYYDPGTRLTYPEVSCRAYFTYHADGSTSIVTDPSFVSITGEFNTNEFIQTGRSEFLRRVGVLTPREISDADATLSECRTRLVSSCM